MAAAPHHTPRPERARTKNGDSSEGEQVAKARVIEDTVERVGQPVIGCLARGARIGSGARAVGDERRPGPVEDLTARRARVEKAVEMRAPDAAVGRRAPFRRALHDEERTPG